MTYLTHNDLQYWLTIRSTINLGWLKPAIKYLRLITRSCILDVLHWSIPDVSDCLFKPIEKMLSRGSAAISVAIDNVAIIVDGQ